VTIRNRLLTAFTLVVLMMGLPLVYGVGRLREVREIAVSLRERQAGGLTAVGRLRENMVRFDRMIRSYVIQPDPAFRQGLRESLTDGQEAAERLEQAGFLIEAFAAESALDTLAATTTMLEALVEARRSAEATAFFRSTVQPALIEAQARIVPIGEAINRSSAQAAANAQDITDRAVRTATTAAVLALLVGAAVAAWAALTLVRPLRRLRSSMATVAGGKFVAGELPYERHDEIGDLSRSFRSMTEKLAELDRIRGEFLNVVSHDLKAPLNLIGGCAELIGEERTPLSREQRDLLESIRRHVRLLTERINKLLSLGRLEAHAYPVHPEDLPVKPTFHALVGAFEPQARQLGLDFAVEVDDSAPPVMRADPECLYHEVIGNLLSNAFKFTRSGGRVTVRVWGENDGVVHFTVSDTGPGIPPDKLPLVFSKYFQAGPKGSGAGAGLGLAIARQVVEAHGGSITVQNGHPAGAVFHVTLPAGIPAEPAPPMRVTGPRITRPWPRPEVVAGER
jgi:signal transduction histidine kinase